MTDAHLPVRRSLFVATILTGSFLLFLVQPMVARMALARLGGAPNVWNSAMLVYQALLLAGYGYAHWLGKMPLRRQAAIHIGLLLLAGLTLPITLANLPPPSPGWEALWVPLLLAMTIGPVFLLASAQAPLMQRWFAAHDGAGEPWALYAASNFGSFAGLIAYPLLAEPFLRLRYQSLAWSIGYGLLIVMIGLAARARWNLSAPPTTEQRVSVAAPIGAKRIATWLALSAVPSGLMLSTTTHLTTDIFAMPLLWVIPLGLYVLSFTVAFADRRETSAMITRIAPLMVLLAGGLAMASGSGGTMSQALASVALLFVIAVTLHARFYELRPPPEQLTLFYLVMSIGGALGGLFTALIAPLVFDWVWEHPLLVAAAALLMPLSPTIDWRRIPGLDSGMVKIAAVVLLLCAAFLAWHLRDAVLDENSGAARFVLAAGISLIGLLLVPRRWMFVSVLAMLLLAQGGLATITTSLEGARTRSYFGIYTVRSNTAAKLRTLTHGTTLHGQQSTDPARSREPMTYYGPNSGIGIALGQAQPLFGAGARIGVIGLGTGTLACYHQAGEVWRFYEIDPAVLHFSRNGNFTYLSQCAPDAQIVIGDARIAVANAAPGSFNMLAVDAFSSDAIPLHLLTDEAMGVYLNALSQNGVLMIHISNRFIELEPVLAAAARRRGLAAAVRDDNPSEHAYLTPSSWVAMSRSKTQLDA
ncbi:MAG: hypothetical protein ABIM50_02665, partial [Novosphingobium sp.]